MCCMWKRPAAGTLSYEIRNFTVTAPEGEPEPKPTEPPMIVEEAKEELPSLKDIYADKFDFGTAVPQTAFSSAKLQVLILKQFNILTPENDLLQREAAGTDPQTVQYPDAGE